MDNPHAKIYSGAVEGNCATLTGAKRTKPNPLYFFSMWFYLETYLSKSAQSHKKKPPSTSSRLSPHLPSSYIPAAPWSFSKRYYISPQVASSHSDP